MTMKIWIGVTVLAMTAGMVLAQSEESVTVEGGRMTKTGAALQPISPDVTMSITLDDVDLVDFLRMTTRITGIDLVTDPQDFNSDQRISVNMTDEPWHKGLEVAMAQHGFVLLHEGGNIYSVLKGDKPEVAARVRAALAAVSVAEAVLADIKTNNIASATNRLNAFVEINQETVNSFKAAKQGKKVPVTSLPAKGIDLLPLTEDR